MFLTIQMQNYFNPLRVGDGVTRTCQQVPWMVELSRYNNLYKLIFRTAHKRSFRMSGQLSAAEPTEHGGRAWTRPPEDVDCDTPSVLPWGSGEVDLTRFLSGYGYFWSYLYTTGKPVHQTVHISKHLQRQNRSSLLDWITLPDNTWVYKKHITIDEFKVILVESSWQTVQLGLL